MKTKLLTLCAALISIWSVYLMSAHATTTPEKKPAIVVIDYLSAAGTLDPSTTKVFLSKKCKDDIVTEFQAQRRLGWSYLEIQKIEEKLIDINEKKATVKGMVMFKGGESIIGQEMTFFLVLENGAWKISGMDPAPNKRGPSVVAIPGPNKRGPSLKPEKSTLAVDEQAKLNKDLWYAAEQGRVSDVKNAIINGADVNAKNIKSGVTALIFAAQNGHTETVKALLAAKADVNAKNIKSGVTALICAAQNGHTETVKALLAAKADVNAAQTDDRTALMFAIYKGHTDTAKALLEAGADVNVKAYIGGKDYTPLSIAKHMEYTEITKLLKKYGAKE